MISTVYVFRPKIQNKTPGIRTPKTVNYDEKVTQIRERNMLLEESNPLRLPEFHFTRVREPQNTRHYE